MTRETILILLGALVFISPWSGLPLAWLSLALPVLGLLIAFIGFTLRGRTSAPASVAPSPEPRAARIVRS